MIGFGLDPDDLGVEHCAGLAHSADELGGVLGVGLMAGLTEWPSAAIVGLAWVEAARATDLRQAILPETRL